MDTIKAMIPAIKVVCWSMCIICIFLGVILSLWMIWGDVSSDTAWKAWATLGVFFFASIATYGVTPLFSEKETVVKKEG
jgi:membrane protein YdbS with pleckstrin-like domain